MIVERHASTQRCLIKGWLSTAPFTVINITQTPYRSMTRARLSAGRCAPSDIDLHKAPLLPYGFGGKALSVFLRIWLISAVQPAKRESKDRNGRGGRKEGYLLYKDRKAEGRRQIPKSTLHMWSTKRTGQVSAASQSPAPREAVGVQFKFEIISSDSHNVLPVVAIHHRPEDNSGRSS